MGVEQDDDDIFYEAVQNVEETSSHVEAHVIDIDHCLAGKKLNNNEIGFFTSEDLQTTNNQPSVFETQHNALLSEIKPDHHILCGSNRVTPYIDFKNIQHWGSLSLTEYLKAVQKKTGANLDTFLLGDVINNEESSFCWKKIEEALQQNNVDFEKFKNNLKTNAEERFFKDTSHDNSKITLIYTIIQHLSHQHITKAGKKSITIKFYDDDAFILQALERFYTEHKELIPEGVKLELNHYHLGLSDKSIHKKTIEGTGVPHRNFRESAKVLAKIEFKQIFTTSDDVKDGVRSTIEIGTKPPTFYVFDIDGCLTDKTLNESYSPDDLKENQNNDERLSDFIKHNKMLFDQMTRNDYILCGSNRTDWTSDFKNARYRAPRSYSPDTLSLSALLVAVAKHTSATLDKFLFTDLNNGANDGDAFKAIEAFWSNVDLPLVKEKQKWYWGLGNNYSWTVEKHSKQYPTKNTITHDENKISLIYSIVQRVANEHLRTNKSGKNLVVKFYDDKAGLLEVLKDVYTLFPQLIPQGITLELYQYGNDGQSVNRTPALQASIVGTGVLHTQFRTSTLSFSRYLNKYRQWEYYREGFKKIITQSAVNEMVQIGTTGNNTRIKTTIDLDQTDTTRDSNPLFRLYQLFNSDQKSYYQYTLTGKNTDAMMNFFRQFPNLIPTNVTLTADKFDAIAGSGTYDSDPKVCVSVFNEKRMLSYWYMVGTFVLLCSAAILMGLASEEMIGVAFEDLGNSAKSDLDDKYAGQYLFSTCLFLAGGFMGYKAQEHYEPRETALERKSYT